MGKGGLNLAPSEPSPQDKPRELWLESHIFQPTLAGSVRRFFYNIAARWGIDHLRARQNRLNGLIENRLKTNFAHIRELDQQDVEKTRLIGELTTQVQLLKRRVEALEKELQEK